MLASRRGTSYGAPSVRAIGVPDALRATLGSGSCCANRSTSARPARQPLVLAIAGDQTQHVLWRLQHGELPRGLASDATVVFSLMIGTNNLGHPHGHSVNETARGVAAVCRLILRRAKGRVLLNALLPRGDNGGRLIPLIKAVNARLAEEVRTHACQDQ